MGNIRESEGGLCAAGDYSTSDQVERMQWKEKLNGEKDGIEAIWGSLWNPIAIESSLNL